MTEIFYKYRADSQYTEDIFTSGRVFLSTAEGLNDPFECSLREIGRDWINEKIAEMRGAAVVGFMLGALRSLSSNDPFFGLSKIEVETLIDSFRAHQGIEARYAAYEQFVLERTGHPPSRCERLFSDIDAQLNAVGIFSMSTNPAHPLMWAHYAKDHSGICIGFGKTLGSRLADAERCLPVLYSDSLPEMDPDGFTTEMAFSADERKALYVSNFRIAFNDKTFQRAITTKPTCWSYEDEWRYVEPYSGTFDWPGTITELTFGLRCADRRREHYVELAESQVPNEVHLFEMRRRYDSNSLERVPMERPITRPKHTSRPRQSDAESVRTLNEREFIAEVEGLIKQGKYGQALFEIEQNKEANPGSVALLSLEGMAHGAAEDHEKALTCFAELTRRCPDVAQAWYQLSCALTQLARHQEAVEALRRAFDLDPDHPSTAFNLGIELLRIQNDPVEGLQYLRRAERLGHRRAHEAIAYVEEREAGATANLPSW